MEKRWTKWIIVTEDHVAKIIQHDAHIFRFTVSGYELQCTKDHRKVYRQRTTGTSVHCAVCTYLVTFFNLFVVRLILNLELFKVDQMQTLCQFFL